MAIETLEDPKPRKVYTWRCINSKCEALLRGTELDAYTKDYAGSGAESYSFECPHCNWRTWVPA